MARTPQGTGGFSSTVLTTDLPLVTLASPLSPIAINSVVVEGRDEEPTTYRPSAPSAEKLNVGRENLKGDSFPRRETSTADRKPP